MVKSNGFFLATVIIFLEKLLEEEIECDKASINKSRVMKFCKEIVEVEMIKCKVKKFLHLKNFLKDVDSIKLILLNNLCEILVEKIVLEKKFEDHNESYPKLLNFIQKKINDTPDFQYSLIVFLRSFIVKSCSDHFEQNDDDAEKILKNYERAAEDVIFQLTANTLQCNLIINSLHTDKNKKCTLVVEKFRGSEGKMVNDDICLQMFFMPEQFYCLYDKRFTKKYYK